MVMHIHSFSANFHPCVYSYSSPHQKLPPRYYRVGGLDETSIVRSGFLKDMDLTLRSGMTKRRLSVTFFCCQGEKRWRQKISTNFSLGRKSWKLKNWKLWIVVRKNMVEFCVTRKKVNRSGTRSDSDIRERESCTLNQILKFRHVELDTLPSH